MRTKRQFVTYWLDVGGTDRKFFATDRNRVAYLIKAARSQGSIIHRTNTVTGWNYQIGELCLNERHTYHHATT